MKRKQKYAHVAHERLLILITHTAGTLSAHVPAIYCRRCGAIGRVMQHYRVPRTKWEKTLNERRSGK